MDVFAGTLTVSKVVPAGVCWEGALGESAWKTALAASAARVAWSGPEGPARLAWKMKWCAKTA
ncbi:hypothetical protein GCM10010185_55090 [Saccharothrix coeruleofusca]|uniref:Uncharacterized protein n=1 Tax=Saccharothrix coeruleofusca TaxID=33919 RepID=A0A918ATK6_9PSEU|nr:hypothetical protein GCM10010185_55090 [Saccharothrix coeruleofusca]